MTFDDLVEKAAGAKPYAYQQRIAVEGPPELLRAPTGAGKTLAATLPWLYRRRFHPDRAVRAGTPRWLVFTLPMRVLVEQTRATVAGYLKALGLTAEVGLYTLMGGEDGRSGAWRLAPERDAVFVATLDMVLSRALNRGYGESRWAWPIDFGLFNNGCHFIFDEVQLMGPALPTSRQLEGLRRTLGTAMPCSSTWMSAMVDPARLHTVDATDIRSAIELGEDDRVGPLARRLQAAKRVERLEVDPSRHGRALAAGLAAHHRGGSLTIALLNTVERATEVRAELAKVVGAEVVLVHSRFRPRERAERLREALAPVDPDGPGRVVVSTQVLEAGVDVSARTLFTEAAPWSSVVQRAGRCNRDGDEDDAVLLWALPPKPAPYEAADLSATAEGLAALEGQLVTPEGLGGHGVAEQEVGHAVLRRRDLLDLFDTTPDLGGDDIDVARFIRLGDDLDAQVAWRDLGGEPPADSAVLPTRDERCPVPLAQLREFAEGRPVWRFDHIEETWVRARRSDLRPGGVVLADAADGGYDPRLGWAPGSRAPVTPVADLDVGQALTDTDVATGDDPASYPARWQRLVDHLRDVEGAVAVLAQALGPSGVSPRHLEAAEVAGRLHDLGKVHPSFQHMLAQSALDDAERQAGHQVGQPWAKSGGSKRSRNQERRHFRHELASALALLDEGAVALEGVGDADLVVYLVAAHHGRVRLSFRPLPDEVEGRALGVEDGERIPAVEVPGSVLPSACLRLDAMSLGRDAQGRASWTERALALRDRADLGPFRLGFLEALVRLADWRASAMANGGGGR